MKHPSGRRISLEELEAMSRRDRRRMITMGLGVVVLAVAVVSGKYLEQKNAAEEAEELAAQAPPTTPEAPLASGTLDMPAASPSSSPIEMAPSGVAATAGGGMGRSAYVAAAAAAASAAAATRLSASPPPPPAAICSCAAISCSCRTAV